MAADLHPMGPAAAAVDGTGFDTDEIEMLVETARRILTGNDPTLLVTELAEAGIADAIAADPGAAGLLFGVQGEMLGRSTLLDLVIAGQDHRPDRRVVLPIPGSSGPPGRIEGETVLVDGVVLVPESTVELVVHTGSGAFVVPAEPLRLVTGFDPGLRMAAVSGARTVIGGADARHWDAAVDHAALAIAHELVGVGQRALELAVTHTTEREQFGNPIVALQSVRHRLVDAHVGLEAARAVLAASDAGDEIGPMTAKATAGLAALGAVAAAQQLCGAMGFTAEHGLHQVVRRAYLLDSLFECADDLEVEIGALLAARGSIPDPVPL